MDFPFLCEACGYMIEDINHKKRHDRRCCCVTNLGIKNLTSLFAYCDLTRREKELNELVILKYGYNIYKPVKPKYPCKSMCSNYDEPMMFNNKTDKSRHLKMCKLCKEL